MGSFQQLANARNIPPPGSAQCHLHMTRFQEVKPTPGPVLLRRLAPQLSLIEATAAARFCGHLPDPKDWQSGKLSGLPRVKNRHRRQAMCHQSTLIGRVINQKARCSMNIQRFGNRPDFLDLLRSEKIVLEPKRP